MFAAEIDIRGFNRFVEGIQNALIGTGQDGDLFKVVKSEARLLSAEISSQLGPRTAAQGEKSIEKDMRESFRSGPDQAFESSKRKGAGGDYGLTWLYAGPTFLVGIRDEDIMTRTNLGELRQYMRNTRGQRKGLAWKKIGRRGKQAIMLLDRAIIGRERWVQLKQGMANRVGRLRASWGLAAKELGLNRIPEFVARHFSAVKSDGTGVFRYNFQSAEVNSIDFGSRAPGVTSNARILKPINEAIETRRYKANEKIKAILQGYKYDLENGRVFQRHRGAEMLNQLEQNESLYNSLN